MLIQVSGVIYRAEIEGCWGEEGCGDSGKLTGQDKQ